MSEGKVKVLCNKEIKESKTNPKRRCVRLLNHKGPCM